MDVESQSLLFFSQRVNPSYPEDVVLPDINYVKEETALVVANKKLQIYWKSSPYYLKKPTKKSGENDIKLYSELKKECFPAELKKECFPAELFEGKKKVDSNESKGFSSQNYDQLKFDDFIYREQKYEDRESEGRNEKKKENENESDNEEQEDEEESSEESECDHDKVENPDDNDNDYNQQEDDNPDDDNTYDD
ncbi:glutamic acid-rich protein-like isoform X2 [Papaver somniferum]|uniref:glutamic acid-rich protein-like isoform X2 n=1 Tax=Papaver somniferum TaxID=3469 RepID=UPI000E6F6082|nr:glutamic acid-rich protein-like isoform X2 [Papaver somniferum]